MAWVISNEPWMKKIKQIDNFKIRAGYGVQISGAGGPGASPRVIIRGVTTVKWDKVREFRDRFQHYVEEHISPSTIFLPTCIRPFRNVPAVMMMLLA